MSASSKSIISQGGNLFISYRRSDTPGYAGRLYDRLCRYYGEDRVFMDIDSIQPGDDFVDVIEKAVSSCKVLIAVIGKQWLTDPAGTNRLLDNPHDFVRIEISTALARNIRVIPVLVQGAIIPRTEDLPDILRPLVRRQALEISDSRWNYDVNRLIKILKGELGQSYVGRAREQVKNLKTSKAEDRAVDPINTQEVGLHSINSNKPSAIKFVNLTNQTIRVHWLDFNGKRVFYNSLSPGQSYIQNTFLAHSWVVTDISGNLIRLYVTDAETGEVIIE
jgi:hypothetical protein